jgi:hypothetical protein
MTFQFWRRWVQHDGLIDRLIRTPRQTHQKATPADYETMQAAAGRRRDAADDKRREAARIQSGQPVAERLRLVGRGKP